MSYRDLQIGVLELFVDAAHLGRPKKYVNELQSAFVRPEPMPEEEAWRRMATGNARVGGCRYCGARSLAHRCPVFVVGVST